MKGLATITAAALLAPFGASAQEWAKARIEKSPRHLEWVTVEQGKRDVKCSIAYPEVKEKATAVVVIHEISDASESRLIPIMATPLPATVPRASASKARRWPSGDRIPSSSYK